MPKKYNQSIELMKKVQILLIILCIAALTAYLYYILQPKITLFEIVDECGPISGSIMHSIKDLDTCSNACRNQYCTKGKQVFKTEFNVSLPCNKCICYCRD
jgi:hypothetical protein